MFYDDAVILFDDPERSIGEERFLIIGMIKTSKICIVKLSMQYLTLNVQYAVRKILI